MCSSLLGTTTTTGKEGKRDEEEEEATRKRKVPLPTLDLAESGEKAKERLEQIRTSVPSDKETLFKSKVRWDGVTDVSCMPSGSDMQLIAV